MINAKENGKLKKRFAEFFAGIGLMRMGLEAAGWEILYANDISPTKQKQYEAHFVDDPSHFHLGDIHEIDPDQIPTISLATASFPCTDLSLAGRREGLGGKESSAFWGFIKVLDGMRERKPPMVLLENVVGFLSSHKGQDFKAALIALNELGYVVDAFIIDANHFVPQSRSRLFIVGSKKEAAFSGFQDKQLNFYESHIRPKKLADFIYNYSNEINWSIRPLPQLPIKKTNLFDLVNDTLEDSENWWTTERVEYLISQTAERHKLVIDQRIDRDEFTYLTAFRRVRKGKSMAEIRSDGVAGCLRTPKGGSARQILLRVGKGEVKIRFLSPRECARLMGADDFIITGSTTEALFGFGDAVCVPVVTWIANNYLNPLLAELEISSQPIQKYG